jgi:hypothetical protein
VSLASAVRRYVVHAVFSFHETSAALGVFYAYALEKSGKVRVTAVCR